MKKNTNANLPVLIFMLALLIIWQAGAMGMNAAYILPFRWTRRIRWSVW